jgi:predicted N-acetyltransferase YhbS
MLPVNESFMKIGLMKETDLTSAALAHKEAFPRQQLSYQWLQCNLKAFPRFLSFVAEDNDSVVAYIVWAQKSGFRQEVVLELEQIAVSPRCHGMGIGRELIKGSLLLVREQLSQRGRS